MKSECFLTTYFWSGVLCGCSLTLNWRTFGPHQGCLRTSLITTEHSFLSACGFDAVNSWLLSLWRSKSSLRLAASNVLSAEEGKFSDFCSMLVNWSKIFWIPRDIWSNTACFHAGRLWSLWHFLKEDFELQTRKWNISFAHLKKSYPKKLLSSKL